MCGIAGIFNSPNSVSVQNDIRRMTQTLHHRGPDGEGIFVEGPIALGHRRLSIIDLENGAQPMESANKVAVISFNGEIYNFPELRKQLLSEGYTFATQCDTEVILALYERYGEQCVDFLRGMFTFALWDRKQQKLMLARDRIGIKPLYYTQQNNAVYFASEIKAIRAVLPINELNTHAVNAYFTRQYIGGNDTIFKQIYKVPAGAFLVISANGVETKRYWHPPLEDQIFSQEEAAEQLNMLLNEASANHLLSDVPVGVFLSGGLDSSCVLAYATKNANKKLHTFSVGFGEESPLSETKFAAKLARKFGTIHHEIQVTHDEMLNALPLILQNLDEPFADYAIIPTYIMSKFASEHVKVVLSGEGADELFGGYKRYHLYALFDMASKIGLNGFFGKNMLPGPSLFNDKTRRQLLNDRFGEMRQLPSEQKIRSDKEAFFKAGHLNSMLYTDIRNWLVDDLLMKVDKMSMLASIEARVPYLDHHLVEFVLPLQGTYKAGLTEKKKLLKNVANRILPPEIWQRRKHGFTVPVSDWLKGPLHKQFKEIVFERSSHSEWINTAYVEKLLRQHENGTDVGFKLWSIFIFCRWMEMQVGRGIGSRQ